MWSAIFSSISHPCVVTDVPADGKLGVSVDMLSGMEIIVTATPAITLESVPCVVDVLGDVLVVVIDIAPAVDVGVLADENVNGLAAVIAPSEFTLSAP